MGTIITFLWIMGLIFLLKGTFRLASYWGSDSNSGSNVLTLISVYNGTLAFLVMYLLRSYSEKAITMDMLSSHWVFLGIPIGLIFLVFPMLMSFFNVNDESYLRRCLISIFFHLYSAVAIAIIIAFFKGY